MLAGCAPLCGASRLAETGCYHARSKRFYQTIIVIVIVIGLRKFPGNTGEKEDEVCISGAFSGINCGELAEVGQPSGAGLTEKVYGVSVRGMYLMKLKRACQPGDSGAPVFTRDADGKGATAVGILSSREKANHTHCYMSQIANTELELAVPLIAPSGRPARRSRGEDLMNALEGEGILDRGADALPTVAQLGQRRRAGLGLRRPELAVLLAHAKRSLTDALLGFELIEDPWFERDLHGYFPPAIVARFGHLLGEHRLRRELTATLIANEVVDALGPSFVSRLSTELGAPPAEVVRAYRVARDTTGAVGRFAAIDAMDADMEREVEVELLDGVERLLEAVTRWHLQNAQEASLQELCETGHEGFDAIKDALETAPPERVVSVSERLQALGVAVTLADAHALAADLAFAPDVLAVAAASGRGLEDVGMAFVIMGDRLRFGWLEAELDDLPASRRIQRWAVQALRDDARHARRDLVAAALASSPEDSPADAIDAFVAAHEARSEHLGSVMHALSVMRSLSVDGSDLAGLMVVVRELRALT